MSAQVKLASRNPGTPARRAATSGTAGASQSTAAAPSSRRACASASTRSMASACTRAARSSVAAMSVAWLSPGGLKAPTSETYAPSDAGRRSRSRQWSNRSGWLRIVTGTSGGSRLITATERFRWPNPWLVT